MSLSETLNTQPLLRHCCMRVTIRVARRPLSLGRVGVGVLGVAGVLGLGRIGVSVLSPCLALTRWTVWWTEVLSLLGLIGPSRQL